MDKTDLAIVGGFLGSGKTTLIKSACEILRLQSQVPGVITNDQAEGLVDTAFLKKTIPFVEEVSGSCFCCAYDSFINAVKNLVAQKVNIILAEPVGSCADISATVSQPVKDTQKTINFMPFTVVADPEKLANALATVNGGLHPAAAYIVERQLAEADIILLNKCDLLDVKETASLVAKTLERYPEKQVLPISAKTGQGVPAWLGMLGAMRERGETIVEMDYDKYAEGEAALGWLNLRVKLTGKNTDWNQFARNLMQKLRDVFTNSNMAVAHVKIMLASAHGDIFAHLTKNSGNVDYSGEIRDVDEAALLVNCRVESEPDKVLAEVKETLEFLCSHNHITMQIENCASLKPGRPNPVHRYDKIVEGNYSPGCLKGLRPQF